MEIILNGNKKEVKEKTTISDLLKEYSLDFKSVVIEHNFEIVKESVDVEIHENDNIEILRIVGGG